MKCPARSTRLPFFLSFPFYNTREINHLAGTTKIPPLGLDLGKLRT
jgi:hypothetical protein